MRCGHADRLMSLELEYPLQPKQAEQLEAHLARCARCRAVRAALRQTEGLFEEHPWSDLESDLTARVLARLPRGRRAVIPSAPAWTRARTMAGAALLVLLLGVSGVLLTGAAIGYGGEGIVPESGRSVIAAGWESLGDFVAALGTATAVLWRALRWPWAAVGGAAILALAVVWGWLWARSGRWRS